MKIIKNLFILLLLILILITGCSPKNDIETSETPEVVEKQTINVENSKEINDENENDVEITEVPEANEESGLKDEITNTVDKTSDINNYDKENNKTNEINEITEIENKVENQDVETTEDVVNEEETDDITLKIEGKVGKELKLTLEELKAMGDISFEADFFSLNSFGTKKYFHFKGVNLWSLLEQKCEITDDATSVSIIAEDGYKMVFTVEQVKKQDYIDEQNSEMLYPMIIAWEENKVEYDISEGAPFKLVVGQKEAGDINKPQWVSNIDKIVVE